MVKKGYKHMTNIFGNDSELFLANFFDLMRHPKGFLRPDLISISGRYKPQMSVESKSGINGKVSLVAYQMHYGVTTEEDYVDLFGQNIPSVRENFLGREFNNGSPLPKGQVAYYYALVSRDKKVRSEDVAKPYSSIKLEWKDIALIPHDLVFYGFAVAEHLRTGVKVEDAIHRLTELMKENILTDSSRYKTSKNKQDWQNFYLRDMKAIWYDDPGIATKGGRERISLLEEWYPGFSDLQRYMVKGVDGNNIYILSNPEDSDLLDVQFRKAIEERRPILEKLIEERRQAVSLIERITPVVANQVFDGSAVFAGHSLRGLNRGEILLLERLCKWQDEDYQELSIPELANDGIPI